MQRIIICWLVLIVCTAAEEPRWSWQQPHAQIDPRGDLRWAPQPYRYRPGEVVRHIDYEHGNDSADGSRTRPWKHHPWDPQATGTAAAFHGPCTYVFKGGVAYRGRLIARESGRPDAPIVLCSDPAWGEGPALIAGSRRIEAAWERIKDERFPQATDLWFCAPNLQRRPRKLWQLGDDTWQRLDLAREPDRNPDADPRLQRSDWAAWTAVEQRPDGKRTLNAASCPSVFSASDPDAYDGAVIWTNYPAFMGTAYATPLQGFEPKTGTVLLQSVYYGGGPALRPGNRFFVEDHPRLLDVDGEWWYDEASGRLYLHSADDPNGFHIEAAQSYTQFDIRDRSHIRIEGLGFAGANIWDPTRRGFEDPDVHAASVRAIGSCSNLVVRNCVFHDITTAVRMHAIGDGDLITDVLISDNDIARADHAAIQLADGAAWGKHGPDLGRLGDARILRNRLTDIGLRPARSEHGHALSLRHARLAEIAGNIITRTGGAGIFAFGGKGGDQRDAPLVRLLIHHNKVVDSLLLTTDWGGIEAWQGGPIAIWSNVSGGAQGIWDSYRHDYLQGERHQEGPMHESPTGCGFGFAYYLDGAYQSAVFNNIAWSYSNRRSDRLASTTACMETMGFQNAWFNNTISNFPTAFSNFWGSKQGMLYLGNRVDQLSLHLAHRTLGIDDALFRWPRIAWARNLVSGQPEQLATYGTVRGESFAGDMNAMRQLLSDKHALLSTVGEQVDTSLLADPVAGDFRPAGPAGRAARVFLPWGLYREVGRWHFRAGGAAGVIAGEHWHLDRAHRNRGMYHELPRHDLQLVGAAQHVDAPLEDWCASALRFDGADNHAVLRDADLEAPITYGEGDKTTTIEQRKHLDAGVDNLLIECVLRLPADGDPGLLLSKQSATDGWRITCDADGRLRIALRSHGNDRCARASSQPLRDGAWHHIVVEIDRDAPQGIDWHIDGRLANAPFEGLALPRHWSLSSDADLLLAGTPTGERLAVDLAFLRIARGTLADAQTDLRELRAWQFDGPFLRDFSGALRRPTSPAGAIQE